MLTQADYEDLTAWLDGELAEADARRVSERVAADPDWRAAWREVEAVDAALDSLPVAASRQDLAGRIFAAVRREAAEDAARRRHAIRWAGAFGALAAAACVVLAVWVSHLSRTNVPQPPPATGVEKVIATVLKDVPQEDRDLVVNLPLFRDYAEVKAFEKVRTVADPDTLSALADLEAREGM